MDCSPPDSPVHRILLAVLESEVKSLSYVWLYVTPWTVVCQAPLSMGFSRQYWSGLPFPSPGDLFLTQGMIPGPLHAGRLFTVWATREAPESVSCSVLSDSLWPMDCSPPGSSVHGVLLARILEWIAIPSSRGSSPPRDLTQVSWITGRFFTIWGNMEARETIK